MLIGIVVGYLNNEMEQDGRTPKVPTFVNITQQDGIKLSDLSVSGYGEDGLDLGGCWGDVRIDMLKKDSSNQKTESGMKVSYYWYDEDGEYEAGWYDGDENPLKNDESELGNADEIIFDIGQGLSVVCAGDYVGCTINCAGQVFTGKLEYPLATDGRQLIGNPLPTSIKLSQITVSGYGEDGLDLGGCWGDVRIDMLKKDSSNQKTESGMKVSYYWYDEDGEYEAGWYDGDENPLKDDESELGNAGEIEFIAGQALSVVCAGDYVGCTVNFPALNLK